jgi:hypothetical protein
MFVDALVHLFQKKEMVIRATNLMNDNELAG